MNDRMTDREIDAIFETLPGGPEGWLKTWGYRDFARALLDYKADNPADNALTDVAEERARQDRKWGGPEHDAHHEPAEWAEFIAAYNTWALMMARMGSPEKYRRRLVQVAALAVAAVEALDRRAPACRELPNVRGEAGLTAAPDER